MAKAPIDMHVHPFTEEAVIGHGIAYQEAADFFGRSPESPVRVWPEKRQTIPIEKTYEMFKEDGIEKVILLNMDAYSQWGHALPNDYIAKYCDKYPDLFVGMCSVDPHVGKTAVKEIERCVEDLHLIGVKFHPSYQAFYPNDEKLMYPIYEKCVELEIPVLFHTGTTRMTHCKVKYSNPELLDDVADDFPELKIITTHFGWPWAEECLAIVWRNPNVYMDLCGWLPRYIAMTSPIVIQYMNSLIPDKIMFGTDYPHIRPKVWIEDFEALVRNGFEWGGKKRSFKAGVREKVLWKNAEKVFKL